VSPSRRLDSSRAVIEAPAPREGEFRRSFADEVAIDFPSSQTAIECVCRDRADADPGAASMCAEITISADQADAGAVVPLELCLSRTCTSCGGRGEVWDDPCDSCGGAGHERHRQRLTVAVPRGVSNGDRFSFSISPPRGPRTRVDVRVAVTA
jgi:DnaJ-class molecular chaperone